MNRTIIILQSWWPHLSCHRNHIIFAVVVGALVITTMFLNWYWNRLDKWRRDISVGYRVCIRVNGSKVRGVVKITTEEKVWVQLPDGLIRARYRSDVWPE